MIFFLKFKKMQQFHGRNKFKSQPFICNNVRTFPDEDSVFTLFFNATRLKSSVLANPARADSANVDPLATVNINRK